VSGPLAKPLLMAYPLRMGTFREPIRFSVLNDGQKFESIEAVVDTGAAYTWIPAPLLQKMGVKPVRKQKLKIANGEVIERDAGVVQIQLRGLAGPTWVIFGDPASEPLLGAITLEEFGLGVDPLNKTLIQVTYLQV